MSRRLKCGFVYCALVAAVLLVGLPGSALSQPVMDLSWNGCFGTAGAVGTPAQNLDFTTAFAPYQLFASVTNVSIPAGEKVFGHQLNIAIGPNVPDAWRFDASGCMTTNFSQVTYNTLGVAGCPGIRNGSESASNAYQYDMTSGNAALNVATAYSDGRATPDAGTTYLLYNFVFSMAAAGGTCTGEADPVCFVIQTRDLAVGVDPLTAVLLGMDFNQGWVSFNNGNCPTVQVEEEFTWGKVKGMYR